MGLSKLFEVILRPSSAFKCTYSLDFHIFAKRQKNKFKSLTNCKQLLNSHYVTSYSPHNYFCVVQKQTKKKIISGSDKKCRLKKLFNSYFVKGSDWFVR